ncbi:MAG: DMT family transporter [Chloroflexi bacterium]|nr:DMT family transporter [Chloroflexota bacterium]
MNKSQAQASLWPYVGLGILAHVLIGSYPVFGKRAIAEVPKFGLVMIAAMAMMLTAAGIMRWREHVSRQQFMQVVREQKVLWLFSVVVAARSVTNILSISLTQAVWVSLIGILAPFPVAMLGNWVFAEPTPPFTYRAAVLATAGAVLMLVPDWSSIGAGFTASDVLGIAVALVSLLLFAVHYHLIRRSHHRHATSGMILFQQGLAMTTAFFILTVLTHEDWSAWGRASSTGWLAVLAVILLPQVGGNLSQITAMSRITPALITSFIALRLVSALLLAGVVLGEQLVAPSQWLGAALVIVVVSGYLALQRRGWRG